MEKLKIYVGLTSWTETLFVYYTTQWFLYFEKSLIYKIINWRVPWKSHVVGSQLTLRSLVKKGLIRMIIVIKRSGCGKYCDNIVEKFSFVSWQIILATKIYLLKKKNICVLIIDLIDQYLFINTRIFFDQIFPRFIIFILPASPISSYC